MFKYFNKDSYLFKLIVEKVYLVSGNRFNDVFVKDKFIFLFDKILGSFEFFKVVNLLVLVFIDIDKNELGKVKILLELIKMILIKMFVL